MKKLPKILIQLGIVITPLFFLPITRDGIDFNKHALLIAFALVLVFAYAIRSLIQRRFVFITTPLDIAVLLFAGAQLISLIMSSPNIVLALSQPTGAGTVFALTIIFFFVRQFAITTDKISTKELHSIFIKPLMVSGAILAFLYILQVMGIPEKLPVPAYMKPTLFTPAGSLFTLVSYLGVCLILAAQEMFAKHGKKTKHQASSFIVAGLLTAGLVAGAYTLMQPENKPRILPQLAGWSIAAETLKAPKNAIFGVAPGNYVNVFTQEKPVGLNSDEYWVFRYNTSSNYFFNTLSEVGILGLAALIFLVYKLVRFPRRSYAIYAILVASLLMPVNLLLLFALYILLAELASHKRTVRAMPGLGVPSGEVLAHAYDAPKANSVVASRVTIVTSLFLASLTIGATYFVGRAYYAEVVMTQGIQNTQTADHDKTYELQLSALRLNPLHPDYRIIFGRTNFALANLIASQEELSDTQRETISQLIGQAVDNARIAVQLYPSAVTWENLAGIHADLIGVAEGADSLTIQYYNEAIRLDPSNPSLRVQIGGTYYSLGAYDAAIRQLEIAVQLKPDYTNAWYNLANAQKQLGEVELSRLSYQQVLRLLDEGSDDYNAALAELEAMLKEAGVQQAQQQQVPTLQDGTQQEAQADLENANIDLNEQISDEFQPGAEEEVVASEAGDLLLPTQ